MKSTRTILAIMALLVGVAAVSSCGSSKQSGMKVNSSGKMGNKVH